MDCCNYSDYHLGYTGGYESYGPLPYAAAPLPYAAASLPYASAPSPYGSSPYGYTAYASATAPSASPVHDYGPRYAPYGYDYPPIQHERLMPIDCHYATKESRGRRYRSTTNTIATTPPASNVLVPRAPPYPLCPPEPPPWPHYQAGGAWHSYVRSGRMAYEGLARSTPPLVTSQHARHPLHAPAHAGQGMTSRPALTPPHAAHPRLTPPHVAALPTYERDPLRGLTAMHDECNAIHAKGMNMFDNMSSPESRPGSAASYIPYEDTIYHHQLSQNKGSCFQRNGWISDKLSQSKKYSKFEVPEHFQKEITQNSLANHRIKVDQNTEQESDCLNKIKQEVIPLTDLESNTSNNKIKEEKVDCIPLPAFQQAFGSTEIGRFSEVFARTEEMKESEVTEEMVSEAMSTQLMGELFDNWSAPCGDNSITDSTVPVETSLETRPCESTSPTTVNAPWMYAHKEIKCEKNF